MLIDETQGSPQWVNKFGKKPVDHIAMRKMTRGIPVPNGDPVYGVDGPLAKLWNEATDVALRMGVPKL